MAEPVNPFGPFTRWLAWLDSHDGRLFRRSQGGQETDDDLACTVPNPPGSTIVTVGDLRAIVAAGRRDRRRPPMANQPQSQPPQPQQQAAPQSAEQHLLRAGAQPQHLQQAQALGLNPDALLGVLARLIPALLQALQGLRRHQGGQATAAAP